MHTKNVSINGMFAVVLLLINAILLETALVKNTDWYKALWVTLPLLALAIYQSRKKKIPAGETPADTLLLLKK